MSTNLPPLVWSESRPPTKGVCYYDHCDAETPFGRIRIEWKSWKDYPGYTPCGPDWWSEWVTENTLEDAKVEAERIYHDKLRAALA